MIPLLSPQQVCKNTLIRGLRKKKKKDSLNLLVRLISFFAKAQFISLLILQKLQQIVDSTFQFRKIYENTKRRHELLEDWTLQHNNARPQVTISIQQYVSKFNFKILSHTLPMHSYTLFIEITHYLNAKMLQNTDYFNYYLQFDALFDS